MTSSTTHQVPPLSADRSFPYVLLCSTFGTVISLATVWIMTAQSFAAVLTA